MFFDLFWAICVYLRGNLLVRLATQRKSLRKFKFRHLQLLAGPFRQGFTGWKALKMFGQSDD